MTISEPNPLQIALVNHTFRQIAGEYKTFVRLFYDRLFETQPALINLFHVDIHLQEDKFMRMLALILNLLNNPDEFERRVKNLGIRHLSYGINEHHYIIFQDALLWVLEQQLGTMFTAKVKESWRAVYQYVTYIATENLYNDALDAK